MKKHVKRNTSALFLAALALAAPALGQTTPPAIPQTPAPVLDVVSIQPFDLETPAAHLWRAEKPMVRSGYLLVLKVDPALVYPRQIAEPVLYVGRQTAERVNVGYESGHVVAIVPAVLDPKHQEYLDLSKELIWFGSPELPERVDARRVAREHAAAVEAGIKPFEPEKLAAARLRGGALNVQDTKRTLVRDALRRLVLTYSPQERELVENVLEAGRDTDR
jgi:hypothetical protein